MLRRPSGPASHPTKSGASHARPLARARAATRGRASHDRSPPRISAAEADSSSTASCVDAPAYVVTPPWRAAIASAAAPIATAIVAAIQRLADAVLLTAATGRES